MVRNTAVVVSCDGCGAAETTPVHLSLNSQWGQPDLCPSCRAKLEAALAPYLIRPTALTSAGHRCECGVVMLTPHALARHKNHGCPGQNPTPCGLCPAVLPRKTLRKHQWKQHQILQPPRPRITHRPDALGTAELGTAFGMDDRVKTPLDPATALRGLMAAGQSTGRSTAKRRSATKQ